MELNLELLLECSNKQNDIEKLRTGARIRLTIDKENYYGFPIIVLEKKEISSEQGKLNQISVILFTEKNYKYNKNFMVGNSVNLAIGRTFLAKCKVKRITLLEQNDIEQIKTKLDEKVSDNNYNSN